MTSTRTEVQVRIDALLLGGLVLLLLVAYSPAVVNGVWLPRAALLLLAGAAAIPVLVVRAIRPGRLRLAALAAAGFVLTGLISAALAEQSALSFTGELFWGTGAVFGAVVAALWAAGTAASVPAGVWVKRAFVAGVAVNVGVGILQTLFDTARFGVTALDDRATGLLGNPIHLGAVGVACVLLGARGRDRAGIATCTLGAIAVQLSGTRVALIVLVVGLLLSVGERRDRRSILVVVAVVAGLGIGALVAVPSDATTGVARTAEASTGGVRARLETWSAVPDAVAEHPLLGSGPGRFRTATSPHRTLEAARAEGSERLFYDAHNIVLEQLVTRGVIGFVLFAAWLALAIRAAGGPLAWAALAMLAVHLAQPMSVSSTPIAFILLGVAAARLDDDGLLAIPRPAWITAVPGLAAALLLLVMGFHMEQAELDFDLEHNRAADRIGGWYPEIAYQRARINVYEGTVRRDDALYGRAIEAFEDATRRDPTNPAWWIFAADAHRSIGDRASSGPAYERALAWNPWSARALIGTASSEVDDGHDTEALELLRRADLVSDSKRIEELRQRVSSSP